MVLRLSMSCSIAGWPRLMRMRIHECCSTVVKIKHIQGGSSLRRGYEVTGHHFSLIPADV